MGSFLLFLANFLSILLIASATFIASGMAKMYGDQPSRREYLRRFGIAIGAFVIIAGFLTDALFISIRERHINNRIHAALEEELVKIPSAGLDEVHHYTEKRQLYVLADVHTPATITPSRIKRIQENISQGVDMTTHLTVRSVRSANVTAQGSAIFDSALELDGKFGRPVESLVLRNIAIAEQILREKFEGQHAVYFHRAEFMQLQHRNIIKAYVSGLHLLNADEILQLETAIRKATGDESLELIIRTAPENLQSTVGNIRYGWILGDKSTPERLAIIKEIKAELYTAFHNQGGFDIINVNANYLRFQVSLSNRSRWPGDLPARETRRREKAIGEEVHRGYRPLRLESPRGGIDAEWRHALRCGISLFCNASKRKPARRDDADARGFHRLDPDIFCFS